MLITMLCGNSWLLRDHIAESLEMWDYQDVEVLLIDTGCIDGTIDYVTSRLQQPWYISVFDWCNDFAAARNHALQAAMKYADNHEWTLTIDTDETVKKSLSYGELHRLLTSDPGVLSYMAFTEDGFYAKDRFIRIGSDCRWHGEVHEALLVPDGQTRKIMPGVVFSELPKSKEQMNIKLQRDISALTKVTNANPQDARNWYYLGQTWEGVGDQNAAVSAYQKCLHIRNQWAENAAWAAFRAGTCLANMRHWQAGIDVCMVGVGHQWASPELAWLAAFCKFKLGKFEDAVHWAGQAAALGQYCRDSNGAGRIGFRHLPAWYEGPYDVLQYAYKELNQQDAAATAAQVCQQLLRERNSNGKVTHAVDFAGETRVEAEDAGTRTPDVPVVREVPPREDAKMVRCDDYLL